MKDELDGNILLEFIGLRAKSYAFQQLILYGNKDKNWDEGQILDIKKLKGIQKSIVKKNISFDNYFECLFEKRELYADMMSLRSFNHIVLPQLLFPIIRPRILFGSSGLFERFTN